VDGINAVFFERHGGWEFFDYIGICADELLVGFGLTDGDGISDTPRDAPREIKAAAYANDLVRVIDGALYRDEIDKAMRASFTLAENWSIIQCALLQPKVAIGEKFADGRRRGTYKDYDGLDDYLAKQRLFREMVAETRETAPKLNDKAIYENVASKLKSRGVRRKGGEPFAPSAIRRACLRSNTGQC
jgi:hypothetical protein